MKKLITILLLAFVSPLMAAPSDFDTYNITYTYKGNTINNVVYVPKDITGAIKAVMKTNSSFEQFQIDNNVATFQSFDESEDAQLGGGIVNGVGPSQEQLDAAATATGHLELKHAGAILVGLSKAGRAATSWAYNNRLTKGDSVSQVPLHSSSQRTLAVIVDHGTVADGGPFYMTSKPHPLFGIPIFFNASKSDAFQGNDRRTMHYNWCTNNFQQAENYEACTSVISHENVGHNTPGNREVQIAWLEEVMALRLPASIPTDGSPYTLKEVNPLKEGGLIKVTLANNGGSVHHTNIKVGPVSDFPDILAPPFSTPSKDANWWVPGPKTAALIVSWAKLNGGTIAQDNSGNIPSVSGPTGSGGSSAAPGRRSSDSKCLVGNDNGIWIAIIMFFVCVLGGAIVRRTR